MVVPSKPKPLMVTEVASAAIGVVLLVITGATVATCTWAALAALLVVTITVKLPAVSGLVVMLTVSEVAVALVTLPTALLLKVSTLALAVVLKPKPLMVIVVALAACVIVRAVTTGITVATCVKAPLLTEPIVTCALSVPAAVGFVLKLTFRAVAVADVTVPTAPLSKVTVLPEAVVLKPNPLMVMDEALALILAVLLVMTGVTVATWTAAPALVTLFVVTSTVRAPGVRGGVEKLTVREVEDEAVTVPTARPLKSSMLLPGVALKPTPVMVIPDELAARFVVLLVITGTTVAT